MSKPTVIIGLGGIGSKILKEVYGKASYGQKNSYSYVVMDGDRYSLEDICDNTPQIHAIDLCTNMPLSKCLALDDDAVKNWFPIHPRITAGDHEYIPVRAAGRLAFHTAIRQGKLQELNRIIEDICTYCSPISPAFNVMITGSLCGSTGSALVLPLCLYIRDYVRENLPGVSVNITGYFLLPEIFDPVMCSQTERTMLQINTYAAMREINAFMPAEAGSLPEPYDIGLSLPCFNSDQTKVLRGKPMDLCFLFSHMNRKDLLLHSVHEYMEYAADCILNSLTVLDDSDHNCIDTFKEQFPVSGSCRFAGIGSCRRTVPFDDPGISESIQRAEDMSVPFLQTVDRDTGIYKVIACSPLSEIWKKIQLSADIPSSDITLSYFIPQDEILFIQMTECMNPSGIRPFAPEETAQYYTHPVGAYRAAYQRILAQIEQDGRESIFITPHLDRSWHKTDILPDLA